MSHRAAGGLGQIFVLDVRRPSRVTRLTRGNRWATSQTWSPDGSRLAYAELNPAEDAASAIYVARADGSRPVRILEDAADPAWSPDGRWIAVAKLSPERGLGVVNVARALSGDPAAYRQITTVNLGVPEERADWSPDGKRLAFTSHRDGSSDVWVADVTGDNLRNLTNDPDSLDNDPSWSPDGSAIAFGSTRDSASQVEGEQTGEIYVVDLTTGDVSRLTDAPRGSYAPAWSPDGRTIAFNSLRDGNSEVYVMDADGSDQRRLTEHPEADGFAAWVGRGC